ncbi:MAG: PQQ-binding-like beta-propeller repeat protein [Gammaproteobacteria bacterium]|jgi:alcohol dehydrogenase (cytochrome c)|nr:PQQ-binding-like beta-propeller repeat protein [Gammaproteobacteria bacterium]
MYGSNLKSALALAVATSSLALCATLSNAAEGIALGTFTEEQFGRGAVLYQRECASCHGADLEGAVAPAIAGVSFRKSYSSNGINVGDLFNRIRTSMPPRQIDVLNEDEYIDVVAYVLGRNNVLPGDEPLSGNYAALARIPFARSDEGLDSAATFIAGEAGLVPSGSGPSFSDLQAARHNFSDWLYHNQNYKGTRYSGLDAINVANVGGLQQICAYQLDTFATMQTGPIVHDGVMYITNATRTAAINAATCERVWDYTWEPKDRSVWGNSRGVAIKDGYVVRGTSDGYLLALDSANGNLLWARQVADPWLGETFTMPPMIFEDTVLIGPAGSENAISGWVGAFSLEDGTQRWRFETVPEAKAGGGPTWGNPEDIVLGGGAVWTPLSMDLAKGELYAAVSNPAPDLPAYLRPGENLYTNNIVALDPRTGELLWHKSIVPNDDHDWDLTQVSPVLKAAEDNVSRDLVATVGKDGILRTLDKNTREALYETPITTILNAEVPVTTEGVFACPGVFGGVLWSGPAYHPGERLLITPVIDYCARFVAANEFDVVPGQMYMGGGVEPANEQSGWLTAVDAEGGDIRWRYQSPAPMVAGVTTTAGGLVLTGELTGNLLAIDVATGEVLNSLYTGAPVGGGVITYEVEGRQFVAVPSGNAMLTFRTGDETPRSGSVIVYALPE